MKSKAITLFTSVFVLLVIGMFVFAYLAQNEKVSLEQSESARQ